MCIQDQGASSFRLGSEYILRYLEWLEVQGYPMDTISFKKCNKSFRWPCPLDGVACALRQRFRSNRARGHSNVAWTSSS